MFKLKNHIYLRGWKDRKYCIYNTNQKKCIEIKKEFMQFLEKCNGQKNDCLLLSPYLIPAIKLGIIEFVETNIPIKQFQAYKYYDCKYIDNVQWSITENCNCNCKHCYVSSPIKKSYDISLDECKKIIKQIADCGIMNISLTGGEALLREDFFLIIDELKKYNLNLTDIYTNGILISQNFLERLSRKKIKPTINISFDGIGHHDWMRGINGAETAAINALKFCKYMGFKTVCSMCVNKINIDSIDKTIKLLDSYNVSFLKISNVFDSTLWSKNNKYSLTLKETYDKFLNYISIFLKENFNIGIQLGHLFIYDKKNNIASIPCIIDSKFASVSNCYNQHLFINAYGKIFTCTQFTGTDIEKAAPSILLDTNLSDYINNNENYIAKTKVTIEQFKDKYCNNCKYKKICSSGCRVQSFINNSKFFSKDPVACFLFNNGYVLKTLEILKNFNTKSNYEKIIKYINEVIL